MRALGVLFLVLLLGTGAFMAKEILGSRAALGIRDRCLEGTAGARPAFEAGPAARTGPWLEEPGPGQRAETLGAARQDLILCRAEGRFGGAFRDTLRFALVPAANGADGQFMVHAAPGEFGRRSVLTMC